MNKLSVSLLGLLFLTMTLSTTAIAADNHSPDIQIENESSDSNSTIERTLISRGTQYNLTINTSNHTVRVSAKHFAKNKTAAGYVVDLNGNSVINADWHASQGETHNSNSGLMYKYNAMEKHKNITLSTYGGSIDISYNFTVPRQYNGSYLRPTITNVEINRLNRSYGRVTVTIKSDSIYYYPIYYQIWGDEVKAEYIGVQWEKGENLTTASVVMPVKRGEPFEGEIRAHSGLLNETGPLHSQWEFYGYPGDAEFTRVPYEPMRLDRVSEYTYVNESDSVGDSVVGVSDALFRRALGGAGVVLLVIVVLGVVAGRRRRV